MVCGETGIASESLNLNTHLYDTKHTETHGSHGGAIVNYMLCHAATNKLISGHQTAEAAIAAGNEMRQLWLDQGMNPQPLFAVSNPIGKMVALEIWRDGETLAIRTGCDAPRKKTPKPTPSRWVLGGSESEVQS